MGQRRPSNFMRVPFSIAIPALRSGCTELKVGMDSRRICLFCDLPWICFEALAYLAKSCLLHHDRPQRRSFLDGEPPKVCDCPHCVHTRHHQQAA